MATKTLHKIVLVFICSLIETVRMFTFNCLLIISKLNNSVSKIHNHNKKAIQNRFLLAQPNVFLVLYMYVNSGVMSIIVLPTDLEITVPLS